MKEKTIEKICRQQKGLEDDPAYYVGEQLKEIVRSVPGAAELVYRDLDIAEMSLAQCEKKIKARADEKHKKKGGNCAFVSPVEAKDIICKFYGITAENVTDRQDDTAGLIDLDSFL